MKQIIFNQHARLIQNISFSSIYYYGFVILWCVMMVFRSQTIATAQERPSPHLQEAQIELLDLAPLLQDRLKDYGIDDGAKLSLSNPSKTISAAYSLLDPSDITQVNFSKTSGRFVIRLPALQGAPSYIVTGYALTPIIVPVLLNTVERGEIIQQNNIEWLEIDKSPPRNHIANAEDIIGKVARRPLNAGIALRKTDVKKPILIRKGAIITMLYETAGMTLSHRGLAESNGGLGDVISVKNPNTDKIIKAVIFAPGKVQIVGSS